MSLLDLQRRFVASMTLSTCDPLLLAKMRVLKAPSLYTRVKCYRNNLHYGLIKALAKTYPVICRLVGQSFFEAVALKYVIQEIPTSYSLNDYGENFDEFLSIFPPIASLPYLPEVARLEWQIHRVLIGPENSKFDFKSFAAVQVEKQSELCFYLAENAVLFESTFPVDKIWAIHQEDPNDEETVDLSLGGSRLLILRDNYDLRLDKLSEIEWQCLKAMKTGVSLPRLRTLIPEWAPEFDDLMPNLVAKGYIHYTLRD